MMEKAYPAAEVIAAQRRVLDMVAAQIEQMPSRYRMTLRPDRGTGLITWDEILDHVKAAIAVKVQE